MLSTQYLRWFGKLMLALFWLGALSTLSHSLAKPFAGLLTGVAVLLLLTHLALLCLVNDQLRGLRNVWLERALLLVFGTFQLPAPLPGPGESALPLSERGADSGQAD